jgi:hypothetical protein
MARRKTMNVEDVKEWANTNLSLAPRGTRTEYVAVDRAWRQGVMTMLENVLMSTDNYKGFRYLALDEVPTGCTPGIRRDRGEEKQFENTDDTRVRYF